MRAEESFDDIQHGIRDRNLDGKVVNHVKRLLRGLPGLAVMVDIEGHAPTVPNRRAKRLVTAWSFCIRAMPILSAPASTSSTQRHDDE